MKNEKQVYKKKGIHFFLIFLKLKRFLGWFGLVWLVWVGLGWF